MKKIILVDGNNLMFRSYYATAYNGNTMKNSKGYPTNALFGFTSMINKIIHEENPSYIAVAFDIGKNFRHEKYTDYKLGRKETPEELKIQMIKVKELLDSMGIVHLEKENYEADDIIGTIVKMAELDPEFNTTIISSDKDLLQLINHETDVKLLKQKGFIRYNEETFREEFKLDPIKIIDIKSLSGDASDNIPGVPGIGEKTALSLLQKYGSLDNIYNNIESIKGKQQEKLINNKESAYFSYEIATIYKDVPLNINLENLKYIGPNNETLSNIYRELEFYSLLNTFPKDEPSYDIEYNIINKIEEINITNEFSFYIECNKENYHQAEIIGMSVSTKDNSYYINPSLIKPFFEKYNDLPKYTYDQKKNIVLLNKMNITIKNVVFDIMIASYLLEISNNSDIAILMNNDYVPCPFFKDIINNKITTEELTKAIVLKSKYIINTTTEYVKKLKMDSLDKLFYDIELPLINVLAKMEINGVNFNISSLEEMKSSIAIKIELIEQKIWDLAGIKFNISSPKQLGEILFERLSLPYGKKNKNGYSTDVNVLNKLITIHPIINYILEHRNYSKLYSTYLVSLENYIYPDNKIHTIFKQNITRTGRLSSIEPNIQNIPTKDEDGRKIRKCFIPSKDSIILCSDYSQIELRILAHISNSKELIEAFNNNQDIHTKVASDIFGVEENEVTKSMRKSAKAVIFGIVYGISGFGLGENLEISSKEAKTFIDKYLTLYPGVKNYMDNIVLEAKEYGYVKTLFNRKRTIEELNSPVYMIRQGGERIALNTPIQGTSADIIKKAMIEIDNEFTKLDLKSKMIIQVHDELVFDCLKIEKDIVTKIVKDKMENIIKLSVPIKVEIDSGNNWYEAK